MKVINHIRRKGQRINLYNNNVMEEQHNGEHDLLISSNDEEKCSCQITPPLKKRSYRQLLVVANKWMARLVIVLIIIHHIIFLFRYLTMGRPTWMGYRYGSSLGGNDTKQCLLNEKPSVVTPPKVVWEWNYYRNNTSNNSQKEPQRRLLIAQFSGFGRYSQILERTARVNKAYGKRWGHDVVVLQGTAMTFEYISPECDDNPRSTFDKIPLLELALKHKDKYDYVLILDADAMIHDFEMDVTELLPESHVLAAQRNWMYFRNTWDINCGIVLWNLHHPTVEHIAKEWRRNAENNQALVLERNDDQYFLQLTLLKLGFWRCYTFALVNEFKYYQATAIYHFIRLKKNWSGSLEQRLEQISQRVSQVCDMYAPHCQEPLVEYSKNVPNESHIVTDSDGEERENDDKS